jgi:hypothetical protein
MKASISKTVEKTLAPQLVYGLITTGLITWVVLAANPEPVFTKAMAIVSAVMLAYLGIEVFLEVVEASRELKRASDRAVTLEELDQAGQRFAIRVGPEVARVFVLAVTVVVSNGMVGGAAFMASRLAMLPRFPPGLIRSRWLRTGCPLRAKRERERGRPMTTRRESRGLLRFTEEEGRRQASRQARLGGGSSGTRATSASRSISMARAQGRGSRSFRGR